MRKTNLIIIFFVFVLVLFLLFFSNNLIESKKSISPVEEPRYTHTKAICNQTNYCQDYEIECRGKQLIKVTAITGAFAQYSSEWQDPRDEKTRNNFCN